MEQTDLLGSIPDDELLRRLVELTRQSRGLESDLVAHIGEVDARRLYAREASPSMFAYCTQTLHLSEAQAYLRIAAARAARNYPMLLVMLADGRLHVSGIAKLAAHLTRENADEVLRRATHGSKRQIDELVAELAPRPDAPAVMRRLPTRRRRIESPLAQQASAEPIGPTASTRSFPPPSSPAGDAAPSLLHLCLDTASAADPGTRPNPVTRPNRTSGNPLELRPDAVVTSAAPKPPAEIQPLAPSRYRVQFTASAELHDKLERLRALMRSEVPDGDLAALIEAAVSLKLQRLEARRFAAPKEPRKEPSKPMSPRKAVGSEAARSEVVSPEAVVSDVPRSEVLRSQAVSPTAVLSDVPRSEAASSSALGLEALGSEATRRPSSRYIPAAVRRAVWQRDGNRCRYVDTQGRRCSAREHLEFHHRYPFGMGGHHGPENVALLCRAHNLYVAQHDYGRETMAACIREKRAET